MDHDHRGGDQGSSRDEGNEQGEARHRRRDLIGLRSLRRRHPRVEDGGDRIRDVERELCQRDGEGVEADRAGVADQQTEKKQVGPITQEGADARRVEPDPVRDQLQHANGAAWHALRRLGPGGAPDGQQDDKGHATGHEQVGGQGPDDVEVEDAHQRHDRHQGSDRLRRQDDRVAADHLATPQDRSEQRGAELDRQGNQRHAHQIRRRRPEDAFLERGQDHQGERHQDCRQESRGHGRDQQQGAERATPPRKVGHRRRQAQLCESEEGGRQKEQERVGATPVGAEQASQQEGDRDGRHELQDASGKHPRDASSKRRRAHAERGRSAASPTPSVARMLW